MPLPQIPGLNIFIVSPPSQQGLFNKAPEHKEKKDSKLIEALKRKREEERHQELLKTVGKVSNGIQGLPHLEASAGGS